MGASWLDDDAAHGSSNNTRCRSSLFPFQLSQNHFSCWCGLPSLVLLLPFVWQTRTNIRDIGVATEKSPYSM